VLVLRLINGVNQFKRYVITPNREHFGLEERNVVWGKLVVWQVEKEMRGKLFCSFEKVVDSVEEGYVVVQGQVTERRK